MLELAYADCCGTYMFAFLDAGVYAACRTFVYQIRALTLCFVLFSFLFATDSHHGAIDQLLLVGFARIKTAACAKLVLMFVSAILPRLAES